MHDVAPTLAISGAASVNEGSSYTLNLSSSDPGADTITQWTINWGDSTRSRERQSGERVRTPTPMAIRITRSAPRPPTRMARLPRAIRLLVAVLNVAPTLAISGAADVNEGSSYTLNLSSFDPGTDTITSVDDQLGRWHRKSCLAIRRA